MELSERGSLCEALFIILIAIHFWVIISAKECCARYYLFLLAAPLYLWSFPGCYGLFLLCCSLCLCYAICGRKELLSMHGRAVLITGCDSGFGHGLAKLLSDKGVIVFAGVLDISGPATQALREHGCQCLHVLQLDVTDRSQTEKAYQFIQSLVGEAGLWGLVNNAGIMAATADVELQPITTYRRCLDVNFLSVVQMCQVFLPLLRKARGRIVNVSSMAAEVPMPMLSAYGVSKAALSLFSRVTRLEMAGWGVSVSIIQPSGFRTNIFRENEIYHEEMLNNISPDARQAYGEAYISSLKGCFSKMADISLEDLSPVLNDMCHALMSSSPKTLYTPGRASWLLPFLYRLCPTAISDILIMRLFKFTDCHPVQVKKNRSGNVEE